jgi:hypothetical protein
VEETWIVFQAADDWAVRAQCVDVATLRTIRRERVALDLNGSTATIRVAPSASREKEWRVIVSLMRRDRESTSQFFNLDKAGACPRCGKAIMDAVVRPDGLILVGHPD